jgi:DNA-binding MarR family transcriptional regulator
MYQMPGVHSVRLDGRGRRKEQAPDLAILALRLLLGLQGELFARLAAEGFDDVRPRHGAVLAFLDGEGTRPRELARRSGRQKQALGATIDDLVALGYVSRQPDPEDGRGRLIVPTRRGLAFMRRSDEVVAALEANLASSLGSDALWGTKANMAAMLAQLRPRSNDRLGQTDEVDTTS